MDGLLIFPAAIRDPEDYSEILRALARHAGLEAYAHARRDADGWVVVVETRGRDGQRLVSWSNDGSVRTWPVDGVGEAIVLTADKSSFTPASVSFDAQGRHILATSSDGTAYLWPASGYGQPAILRPPGVGGARATLTTDGDRVVHRVADERVARVWDVGGAPLQRALWRATSHCPSVTERMRLLGLAREQAEVGYARCQERVESFRRPMAEPLGERDATTPE